MRHDAVEDVLAGLLEGVSVFLAGGAKSPGLREASIAASPTGTARADPTRGNAARATASGRRAPCRQAARGCSTRRGAPRGRSARGRPTRRSTARGLPSARGTTGRSSPRGHSARGRPARGDSAGRLSPRGAAARAASWPTSARLVESAIRQQLIPKGLRILTRDSGEKSTGTQRHEEGGQERGRPPGKSRANGGKAWGHTDLFNDETGKNWNLVRADCRRRGRRRGGRVGCRLLVGYMPGDGAAGVCTHRAVARRRFNRGRSGCRVSHRLPRSRRRDREPRPSSL